jgi:ribosome-binding factor A
VNQRVERVAAEIRELLGETLVRGDIKDPRVSEAGLITFTHVRVTGDLRQATALFIVHNADDAHLKRVQAGLTSASGYLRRALGQRLRMKNTPTLAFEIDRVFEKEEKVDALLREISPTRR